MSVSINLSGKRLALGALIAGMLIAYPLVVLAGSFSDVPSDNSYYNDIEALKAKGVTTGCAPGLYCPKDYVTREQMAAFMNRLGALSPSKTPVVNADKVDGYNANALMRQGFSQVTALADGDSANAVTLGAQITVPSAGYLIVQSTAAIYFEGVSGGDQLYCALSINGEHQYASERIIDVTFGSVDADDATCATSAGYLVCASGAINYALDITSIGIDTNVNGTVMTAQFTPFDANGSAVSCSAKPQPAQEPPPSYPVK